MTHRTDRAGRSTGATWTTAATQRDERARTRDGAEGWGVRCVTGEGSPRVLGFTLRPLAITRHVCGLTDFAAVALRARPSLPTPLPGPRPPAGRAPSSAAAPRCPSPFPSVAGPIGTACAARWLLTHASGEVGMTLLLPLFLGRKPGRPTRSHFFGRRLCGAGGMARAAGSSAVHPYMKWPAEVRGPGGR